MNYAMKYFNGFKQNLVNKILLITIGKTAKTAPEIHVQLKWSTPFCSCHLFHLSDVSANILLIYNILALKVHNK